MKHNRRFWDRRRCASRWQRGAHRGVAGDTPKDRSPEKRSGPARAAGKDAKSLAESIDRLLAARWAEAKVQPAPPADDAEYLRRVCLDLVGKIPTAAEARDFLDDPVLTSDRDWWKTCSTAPLI